MKYLRMSFVICLIFILCLLLDTNIMSNFYYYLTNSNYSTNVMMDYGLGYFSTLIELLKNLFLNYEWYFDYILVWSGNIYQLLLPFVSVLLTYIYFKDNSMRTVFKYSINQSFFIFLGYLMFLIFVFLITGGKLSNYMSREFFLDILGDSFLTNHYVIYYFLDGMNKFFITTFLFTIICINFASLFKEKYILYFYYIFLYFFLYYISQILEVLFSKIFIYLNPSLLLTSGAYENISTVLCYLFPGILYFISYYLKRKKDKYEKV